MNKKILLYILLGILMAQPAVGQKQNNRAASLRRLKMEAKQRPPKAILVEIFMRERLMNHYVSSKQTKKEAALKRDIEGVKNAIVADFSDNYTYGPVYFFYDTDADAVRAKKFEGVLMDKDLKPAKNIVLTPTDSNYFIVYFGTTAGSGSTSSFGFSDNHGDNELRYSSGTIKREAYRLQLLDPNFNELPQYVVRDAYNMEREYRHVPKYSYNSSLLKIYYWAFAAELSKKFSSFYR